MNGNDTESADALNARGCALHEQRQYEEAVACFERALELQPDHVIALNNRGNSLLGLWRLEEALASYDRALQLEAGLADAHNNRGCALLNLQRHEQALESFGRAIALRPEYAVALNNRGLALQELRRHEEALASFDQALALGFEDADAFNNRGNALLDLKRDEEALLSYHRGLALRPDDAGVLNNSSCALLNLKRYEEALASVDRAIELRPEFAAAFNNRGYILQKLKRPDHALTSYDRALALAPDYAEALSNRGNALLDLTRLEEALASYDRALALKPDYADALNNRGCVLLDLKRHEDAARDFLHLASIAPEYDYAIGKALDCQLRCCEWSAYNQGAEKIENAVAKGKKAATPFFLLSISSSAANQLQCARTYAADKYPAYHPTLWNGERYRHEKIRLAYLSADFRDHATAYLMAELFETHDKERFEITAISYCPDDKSEMRARLRRSFHRFADVHQKSDREIALMLREWEIDVAVDLAGFAGGVRAGIMAHRPVPVQVNYLGYPGTMGADYMDYIIADSCLIPEEHQIHYAEKVVFLPETYQVNDSKRAIAVHIPGRAELGLAEAGFVFCCFNNNYKINPRIFDIWMRLLGKVEGSVFWLLEDNADASRNLRHEAKKRGIDPARLVFAKRLKLDEHLARHRHADLFLDTLPCNAHTTASDALWAGLPVLTCLGGAFAGRVAGSLLHAIGLPELIAHTLDEYEVLALKLAQSADLLAEIRAKLARNRSGCTLFNTDRFRRHLESAYITMWERYQRGEPPASFAVQAQA